MALKDEYINGDPYGVDFKNYFHKERLRITIDILKNISNHSKVLDIGCGKGYFTSKFNINDNEVLGIDYSSKAIEFAKINFSNKKIIFETRDVGDLININYKFDVIVANNLIEHIDNVNQFFKDCYALLNKSGYIIISTPNIYSFKNIITLLLTNRIKYRSDNHVCEYTKIQIRYFCENNNFSLIKIYPQYQFKSNQGLKYRFFNFCNFIFKFLNIFNFASTYFYLIRKNDNAH